MPAVVGQTGSITRKVTQDLSAHTLGNPGIDVLATPCLAGLCDEAAAKVCGDSRRMRVDIRHLAATPVGDDVHISAEIVAIDGDCAICRVEGRDSRNRIVSGNVSRLVA